MLPLRYSWRELPAEVLPQALISEAVAIEVQPSHESVGIFNRPTAADDRIVSDLVGHSVAFLAVVRNVSDPFWCGDCGPCALGADKYGRALQQAFAQLRFVRAGGRTRCPKTRETHPRFVFMPPVRAGAGP
jgi:hypothetical protein